jgi:D-alanyl-D-alanine carboxypeptidase
MLSACFRTFAVLLGLVSLSAVCTAQSTSQPNDRAIATTVSALQAVTAARIDRAVAQILADTGVPSASLSVVQQGRVVYSHAYGKARLEPPTEASTETRYEIGSISKQFTAAAMLLLQEDGKVNLDDPVSKYFPDLTRSTEVTLRMVLSHTSGYQDYWPEDYVMPPMLKPVTTGYILDTWAKKPLDFEPGTQWQYSNTNYAIAAAIIEKVSGVPYFNFIQSRILAPLEMHSAIDVDTGEARSADAQGYYRHALGPPRPAPREGKGWMFGAFELAMTPRDLSLWNISLINRTLLKPESYQQMFTSAKLKDGTDSHYGLGVFTTPRNGHAAVSHGGESSGFVSQDIVFPDDHAAISVFTNEDAVNAAAEIAREITPLILGNGSLFQTAETEALAIFTNLQRGKIDRTLLTPNCNAYFSRQALDDFATSLTPLGSPLSFHQTSEELRGGMIQRVFLADFGKLRLNINTYVMPDGKYEQYLVVPTK